MITPLLSALFLALQAQVPAQTPGLIPTNNGQRVEREIEGVLLVSGDPAETKRAKNAPLTTEAEVKRLFPAPRYEMRRWNDRYLIAIDRTTGPLGAIEDRNLLTRAFAKALGRSRTLDLAALGPVERQSLKAWIRDWARTGQPSVPQIPSDLGVQIQHYVVLKAGSESHQFVFRTPDPGQESMLSALREKVLNRTAPESDPLSPKAIGTPPPRDEYDFVYVGIPGLDRTEGIRIAADMIGKIETQLRQESNAAMGTLLQGLGYRLSPDLQGTSDTSQMSKEMRYQIADQLRIGWEHMGFASKEEAMEFLNRAGSFEVHTTFSLYQALTPGDPAHMVPSTGVGWQIHDLTGAYLP